MEGPTPVSALIHAATMVNAGVYMVARSNPIFAEAPVAMMTVATIGTFTAIFAAAIALTQNDIKKVLAYSTVSQLAYMFLALGVGAWVSAIFHLVAHGFFKGLLFMGSGSVIHGAARRAGHALHGQPAQADALDLLTMVIGSLALAGIPLFAGFFSKDEILAVTFNHGYFVFYVVGVTVALMTAFYTFRMIFMTFWGEWRGPKAVWDHIHESARPWSRPLVILAVPTALAGPAARHPARGRASSTPGWRRSSTRPRSCMRASCPARPTDRGEDAFSLLGSGGLLLGVGTIVAVARRVAGVSLVRARHRRRQHGSCERIPFGLGPGMYRASLNKYYVDDIYGLVFARGGVLVANALWWFDVKVIDGLVNGTGWLATTIGGWLRKIQTGRVENYGLGIAAGLAIVLLVLRDGGALMDGFPLLSAIVFMPAIGALLLLFVPGRAERAIRWIALLATLVSFGLSLLLLGYNPAGAEFQFREDVPWIEAFGISYSLGVDGISVVLVILTTLLSRGVGPLLVGADRDEGEGLLHHAAAAHGRHARRLRIARPVPLLRLLGGQPLPDVLPHRDLGRAATHLRHRQVRHLHPRRARCSCSSRSWPIAIAHAAGGNDFTFSYEALRGFPYTDTLQALAFLAFFLAFAIKVPMWPLHTWLPDAHVEAPTAGSIILAGVLLKLGGYGFLRFSLPILPDAAVTFAPIIIGLAIVAIIYGAMVAMVQPDMKKLVAYSSVSHMGFVMLGTFVFNQQGLSGAVFQMISHGITTGALFLLVGVIYEQTHDREIAHMGGLNARLPRYAAMFGLFTFASIGLPGLSGFVGEFLVIIGAFSFNGVGRRRRDGRRHPQRGLHALDVPARLLHRAVGLDAPLVADAARHEPRRDARARPARRPGGGPRGVPDAGARHDRRAGRSDHRGRQRGRPHRLRAAVVTRWS